MSVYIDDYVPVVKLNGLNVLSTTCTLPAATTIGGSTVVALATVTSASATALTTGLNGATNPSFNIDNSTALQAAGLNVKGAVAAGTVALSTISSGGNANMSIDAKGSGTLSLNLTATGGVLSRQAIVDCTTASPTLTAAQSGSIVLIDKADGCMITLPAPSVGLNFTFLYPIAQTSSANGVVTDAGSTYFLGALLVLVAGGATGQPFIAAAASNFIRVTSNKTTTGGLVGGCWNAYCITATQWYVEGYLIGSGSIATPFSAS